VDFFCGLFVWVASAGLVAWGVTMVVSGAGLVVSMAVLVVWETLWSFQSLLWSFGRIFSRFDVCMIVGYLKETMPWQSLFSNLFKIRFRSN
jgi:hypothetical protein